MSRVYKIRDQTKPYFVTITVVGWVNVFARREFCETILDSLKFCQKNKGLIVHAWVIMPSHLHMIIGTVMQPMQNILRDFKSHTSHKFNYLIRKIGGKSRKEWMIRIFENAGKINGNNLNWQFWQQHNQPTELWDNYILNLKLNYLHNNPVKAGIVAFPEHFLWSSAGDYAGIRGPIQIEFL